MRFLTRRIPLAWLQLTHQKVRLTVAICGVVFASLLMLMQLGLKDSLVESASLVEQNMQGDLFLVDKRSKALIVSQPFSQRLLQQALSVPGVESVYPLMAGSAT
ncbi:MAG: ABC transporter, partial [Bryobacteraceae bacterium]|nr:ABC transporter [Bryobacteraceae bacterium]